MLRPPPVGGDAVGDPRMITEVNSQTDQATPQLLVAIFCCQIVYNCIQSDPMNPVPAKNRRSDVAYSRLRHAVMEGQLPPGSHLTELDLCRSLRMSRTPIREALLRLQGDGLIQSVPNAGFSVKHHTLADLEENCRIRTTLESLAIHMACERGFAASRLDELRHQCDLLEEAIASGDDRQANEADLEFHRILISLANSPRLETIIRNSHLVMLSWPLARRKEFRSKTAKREAGDHRRIIQPLARHNADEAARLLALSNEAGLRELRAAALTRKEREERIQEMKLVGNLGSTTHSRRM